MSRVRQRWVMTVGNVSMLDIFDANTYSHDPRTQFFNWALMTHGAYDYAADARGYTWGAALERHADDWAVRAGRFMQPEHPNGQSIDSNLLKHYGDQIEVEHDHVLGGQAGKLRLLVFRNVAKMSRYQDALDQAAATDGPPDLDAVRSGDRTKRGAGLDLEQALSKDVGVFGRASWADGRTETYAFTEIDRSISGGVAIKGSSWHRARDNVGFAIVRNALSQVHRDYLAAGGLGPFIGDGRLDYRPEEIAESYYSLSLIEGLWLTLDWQYIRDPAYNADRGPIQVGAIRLHMEF